ncbi:raffinose/stachyose/melibiose transport system substrate-binding protein [Kineococcus xinjiangensis]|uniref:Raffinose/stachyose/melibiose transport system substrate-binding protein n=1 Tax=Kineococcus xinjiangensis TaxID=512762 RepID=A0A2S6IKC8_9ACTN|nr:extracellular solute-binding protein [Kineococcus xinjiangensis]PPK94692.1 raffinose/stachyose/melibiose transport system substrate-binding protein [Kineococcus xinjiangensis]
MDRKNTSRRSFLGLVLAAPLTAGTLTACSGGTAGPGQPSAGTASIWYLSGQPAEDVRKTAVETFNESHPDGRVEATFFANDDYKTKIRTAVGAGQAPTLIWGWGGGTLAGYAEAGQVDDLTSWFEENPDLKAKVIDSAWGAGTVDGKIYAMPMQTMAPIVLFYNKPLFEQVGAQPPKTWDDLMALVPVFNEAGIAPISLAGQSRWTTMMWLEFLFDRVGGPELFTAVYEGDEDAWSNPDALEALTMAQDLVRAGGFIEGFDSVVADQNADQALLYTNKAAMMLHGTWTYGSMKSDGGEFVPGGDLGYMNFPAVTGGKGDPSNTVGNPAQYLSIYSEATDEQKEIAKQYLKDGVTSDAVIEGWIGIGEVPVFKGIEDQLAASENPEWVTWVYETALNAKSFQQSWDQALSPAAAEELLDNIARLFQLSITPEEFAANMNAVLGQ